MSDAALRERFAALWRRLAASDDGPPFEALLRGWTERHRSYHGLDHLRDCLARLDEAAGPGRPRDLAEAALWYHDVVYQPGARDNEGRSAELARTALLAGGAPEATADEVARLVRLTDHAAPAADPVGQLVCDVDLSILGRPPDEFAEYERRVREEYRQVPASLFRAGRARVLETLLSRQPLYGTDHFQKRYEIVARGNLHRSLASLGRSERDADHNG
jgi:predicted metal-dependent HD superfamily phosphohydrolase